MAVSVGQWALVHRVRKDAHKRDEDYIWIQHKTSNDRMLSEMKSSGEMQWLNQSQLANTVQRLLGTFALMPRGWISRLKKYHDLEI